MLFTHGARMKDENAQIMSKNAKKNNIWVSVHSPYYVVFTSTNAGVRKRSMTRMKRTVELANILRAHKIVLHPGYHTPNAKKLLHNNLQKLQKWSDERGYSAVIAPEVMGKQSQYGSFEEVIKLCEDVKGLEPCIDFGHQHARTLGTLFEKKDYRPLLEMIEKRLGKKVLKRLHYHFYPVEFTNKGEKVHRAHFERDQYP